MCGAVTFTVEEVAMEASACHCGMCLRWAGGPWIGTQVKGFAVEDDASLGVVVSSEWAERGFCRRCGSSLFYRITRGGYEGNTSVSIGALDDTAGITLTMEYFIDVKPDTYGLAGERRRMTAAEIHAVFGNDV